MKFAVLNITALALFLAGYEYTLIPFFADQSYLTLFIAWVFLYGMNFAHEGRWDDVRWIARTLVRLGLIGTVLGFVVALSGVALVSDAAAVSGMVSKLILGMSIALYTTLVGAVCSLWLAFNRFLFDG